MKERLLKPLWGVLYLCMMLFMSMSYAQELVEESSKDAGAILVQDASTYFEAKDLEHADTNRITLNPYGYVRLTVDDDKAVNYHYEYSLTADITPIKVDGLPDTSAMQTKTLKIYYNPLAGATSSIVDLSQFDVKGAFGVRIRVKSFQTQKLSVTPTPAPTSTTPSNVKLVYGFRGARYHPLAGGVVTGVTATAVDTGLKLGWDSKKGAVYYDLEWTWVDRYGSSLASLLNASDIGLTEQEFTHNSTRIQISQHATPTFTIPLVYEAGYLVYRIRPVGVFTDDVSKGYPGPWSSVSGSKVKVSDWPHIAVASHDAKKNWQYQASYAEEGKNKVVVNYHDAALYNRQTVTRINTEDKAVVGEVIYDNEGRAAIEVLPVPVNDKRLRYYERFNKNAGGVVNYSHKDFDWDKLSGNGSEDASTMTGGAAAYYGPQTTSSNNFQDYVPDSEGYPFTQTEYVNDGTGRLLRKSGVGKTHQLNSTHEMKYYYGRADQKELNRLFGYRVGHAKHYKKNMVVDPNGQVSVSYTDGSGKTIATALAGSPRNTSLLGLEDEQNGALHQTLKVDVLNKLSIGAVDTSNDENEYYSTYYYGDLPDGLEASRRFMVSSEGLKYKVDYSLKQTGSYTYTNADTGCGVTYPYAYKLELSYKDLDNKEYLGNSATGASFTVGIKDGNLSNYTFSKETDVLGVGSHGLYKRLRVDEEELDKHIADYRHKLTTPNLPGNNCYVNPNKFAPDASLYSDCDFNCQKCTTALGTSATYIINELQLVFGNDQIKDQTGTGAQSVDVTSLGITGLTHVKWTDKTDDYNGSEAIDGNKVKEHVELFYVAWQSLKKECDLICGTPGTISRSPYLVAKMMLTKDVSKTGQYGGITFEASGSTTSITDDASVFNESNMLIRYDASLNNNNGGIRYEDNNWRYPLNNKYLTASGEEAKIELTKTDTGGYSPEVRSEDLSKIQEVDGPNGSKTYWVAPQYLKHVQDFLDKWEDSWADALVHLHPEYPYLDFEKYYEEKTQNVIVFTPDSNEASGYKSETKPLKSHEFEGYLEGITSYAHATAAGFVSSTGTLNVAAFTNNDAFFTNAIYGLDSNLNAEHLTIMQEAMTTRYQSSGTDKDMWTVAKEMSLCNGIGSCNAAFPTGDTAKQDKIWQYFKSLYYSYKGKIKAVFRDAYAKKRGSYNYCVGNSTATHPVVTRVLEYYSNRGTLETKIGQQASSAKICGEGLKVLYKEKVRRFYPADHFYSGSSASMTNVATQMSQAANNSMYQATGKCPLATQFEAYLNGLATESTQGLVQPSGATAYTGQYLSPHLYTAFGGSTNSSTAITINRVLSTYRLEVTASGTSGGCTKQLWLYETSTNKWANYDNSGNTGWRIIQFKNLYFTGESSGEYNFKVIGVVKEGSTFKEVLFSGVTCAMIGDCETSSSSGATAGVGQVQPNGATLQPETTCEDVLKFETSLKQLLNGLKSNVKNTVNLSGVSEYASDGFLPSFLGDNPSSISGVWSNPSTDRFKITIGSNTPFTLVSNVMQSIMTVHNFEKIVDVDVQDISSNVYDTVKISYKTTGSNYIYDFTATIENGLPYNCCENDAYRMVPMIVLKKEELDSRGKKITTEEVRFFPSVPGANVGQLLDVSFNGVLKGGFSTSAATYQGTNLVIGGVTHTLGSGLMMEGETYVSTTSLSSFNVAEKSRVATTVTSEHPLDFEMYELNYNVNGNNRVFGFEDGSGTNVVSAPTGTNITLSTSTAWVSSPENGVYFNKANSVTGNWTNPDNLFDADSTPKIGFKITPKSSLTSSGFNDYRGFVGQVQKVYTNGWGGTTKPVRLSMQVYMTNEKLDCTECIPKQPEPVACDEKYTYWKETVMKFEANANGKLESKHVPGYLYSTFYDRDNFCNMHFGYLVDSYKYYLKQLGIINIDTNGNITSNANSAHDHFISLSKFGATPLNYGFVGINDAIDAFKAYTAIASTNSDLNDDYSWNEYIENIYVKQTKVCPPMAMIPSNMPEVLPDDDCEGEIALITGAYSNAAYQAYIHGLLTDFKRDYIAKALSSVVETLDVSYKDKEYQYTLYYYDQAGNLKQTVPPEGVHRFDVSTSNSSSPNDAINTYRLRNEYNDTNENNDENTNLVPKHRLSTQYRYNSLNQLVWQQTPDGGVIRFAYDKLGRIIASQNANQKEAIDGKVRFSYTLYDPLGRITEAGEILVPATATTTVASYVISDIGRLEKVVSGQTNVKVDGFEGSHAKREVTRSYHDKVVDFGNSVNSGSYFYPALNADEAFNYRNRISAVLYYDQIAAGSTAVSGYKHGIYYRYDIHGNVKELVQHQPGMYINSNTEHHFKRVHYEYDLVSGNVNKVYYQKEKEDQFIHKYAYDADNRIVDVHTSSDGVIWEREANYDYYEHGPLARVLLGDKRVQAMDYAYTLQGWLKVVNSESAQVADDMGRDGDPNNTGTKHIAQDAFGYSLSYYSKDPNATTNQAYNKDDYKARFPGAVTANDREVFRHSKGYANSDTLKDMGYPENERVGLHGYMNLYNGNIKQVVTSVRDLSKNVGNKLFGALNRYQYDQLDRIKKLRGSLLDHDGTNYTTTKANVVLGDYSFDRSGNLMTLQRWMPNTAKPKGRELIDDFSYKYQHESVTLGNGQASKTVKKHNQLLAVYDAVGVKMNDDLMNQLAPMQTTNADFNATTGQHDNYKYDAIGQLTHDYSEKLKISWRIDGKVAKVERFNTFVYKTLPEKHILKDRLSTIVFEYDGLGNRVAKKVTSYATNGNPTGDQIHYYVYDSSGKIMAMYKYNKPTNQTAILQDLILPRNGVSRTITGAADDEKAFKTITVCSENNALTYHIESTGSQLMQAGEVITLKPGFHAKNGSAFRAKIAPVASNTLSQELVEHHIYGSERIGIENKTQSLSTTAPTANTDTFVSLSRSVGDKNYELSNHLGNVLSVVTDKKLPIFSSEDLNHFKPEVVARNEYMPYGSPVYGRSESGDYRYGFEGQEKDDEIKGKGNSYGYQFRMYDPRVGKFLSLDPLHSEYPWNSPYAFAENKLGLGTELEGKELKYINGEFVYVVKAGQGPSQIARDINCVTNRKNFGYGDNGIRKYHWTEVVAANNDAFVEKGRYKDRNDINDGGYTRLNINPGNVLKVNFIQKDRVFNNQMITKGTKFYTPSKTQEMTVAVASLEANAGYGGGAIGGSIMRTQTIPINAPLWESGRSLLIKGGGFGIGTPGADAGVQLGALTIHPTENPSLTSVLSGHSTSYTGGFIGPIGIGVKVNRTNGDGFSITTAGAAFGVPGPIAGGSDGVLGTSTITVSPPMSKQDSINTALRLSKLYPNSEFTQYLDNLNAEQKRIRTEGTKLNQLDK